MQTLMKFVKSIHYGTLNIERAILIFLLLSLTATMFVQTVARYVIGKGFFAIEEFVGYFAVWVYFIGSAYAAYERTQVSAEIMGMIFKSERTLSIIKVIATAVTLVVAAVMTQWAYIFIHWSIKMGERTAVYQVPNVYFEIPILIGTLLMTIYILMELVDYSRELRQLYAPQGLEGREK